MIYLNASGLDQTFNSSANLTMYNLSMGYPTIYIDNELCAPANCTIILWNTDTGTLIFNVSGFSNYTAAEANQSKIVNNGTTNVTAYLLMKIQFNNSGTWIDDVLVYNSTIGVNSTLIKLDQYFNDKVNTSNLTNGFGMYRVYAALTQPNGTILTSIDGTAINVSYSFNFVNNPPSISSVSDRADGFGRNVTINAVITDDNGINDIDTVLVGITPPDSSETNYSMAYISGNTWRINNLTWYVNGTYKYMVYVNDSGDRKDNQSGSFDLWVNVSIQIRTLKDEYTNTNEVINLTDPPGFEFGNVISIENKETQEVSEHVLMFMILLE